VNSCFVVLETNPCTFLDLSALARCPIHLIRGDIVTLLICLFSKVKMKEHCLGTTPLTDTRGVQVKRHVL